MKTQTMSFGRSIELRRNHPQAERTAIRSGSGGSFDVTFGTWSNRKAMTKTVRMQQSRASKNTDWKPLIPLTDTEGF